MADGFDGEIRIRASIESSEFDKDIAKLGNKAKTLANSISSSSKVLSDLKSKYDALITGTLKTDEEIGIEKSLKRAQLELDNLQDKYTKAKNKIIRENFRGDEPLFNILESQGAIPSNILAPLEIINSKIKETEITIKSLVEKLTEVRMNPEAQESVKKLSEEIEKSERNVDQLKSKISELNNEIKKVKADKLKASISAVADNFKKAFSGLGQAINTPFSIIGKGISRLLSPIRKVSKGISNLFSRIVRLGTLVLVFTTIRRGFQAFRDYLGKALQTNETFMQSLNQIRSNLLTAFYPIYQAILPAINALAQALATASAYLAQFVSMLFGQSISSSQAGAKALNDRINATNTSTKATKKHSTALKEEGNEYDKLYKRVKRANGEIAAFDKLNVLYTSKKSKKTPDISTPDVPESPIFTPTVAYDNTYAKLTDIFDRMKEKLQPTIDAFKKLGDTIKDTFGQFVIRAAQDFYNSFLKPLGEWTLGRGLPEFARITEEMFKNINWGKLNESLNGLWKALEPFAEHVGEGLLWFYEHVLSPIISFTGNKILPRFLNILKNAIKGLDTVLSGVSETFKWFFDTVVKPVAESAGEGIEKILKFFEDLTEKISGNKDALKEFGEFLGAEGIGLAGAFAGFLSVDAVIKLPGYFKNLATAIGGLSAASIPIAGWIVAIGTIIGAFTYLQKKMDQTKESEQQLFQDLGINEEEWKKKSAGEKADLIEQWLNLEKDFATDEERLRNDRYRDELEFSKRIYRTQQEYQDKRKKNAEEFKKFVDDITKKSAETLDWLDKKSAETFQWMGRNISNFFNNIWNGFVEGAKGAFKAVLNAIQKRLDSFIGDINWVIESIRKIPGMDWIPKIPEIKIPGLAQGAVLKGGSPMLAYLNDQPLGQTNIETPLNTMIDAFNTAFKNNNNSNPGNITIEASGDIEGLISFLNFRLKREDARIGTNLIKGDVLI